MTRFIVAVTCAAGFSQIDVEPRLPAPLLSESYHAVPASQMVVKDRAVAMPSFAGFLKRMAERVREGSV